jgi:hypothetical protein
MTSTNMKNSYRNYCLEKNINETHEKYHFYKYKTIPTKSAFPNLGINSGNMIKGYYNNVLSNNACEIESSLFGIGSSDLVNGPKKTYPDLNKLSDVAFFDNKLTRFIPEPLIIESNQRPGAPYSS